MYNVAEFSPRFLLTRIRCFDNHHARHFNCNVIKKRDERPTCPNEKDNKCCGTEHQTKFSCYLTNHSHKITEYGFIIEWQPSNGRVRSILFFYNFYIFQKKLNSRSSESHSTVYSHNWIRQRKWLIVQVIREIIGCKYNQNRQYCCRSSYLYCGQVKQFGHFFNFLFQFFVNDTCNCAVQSFSKNFYIFKILKFSILSIKFGIERRKKTTHFSQ